MSEANGAQYDSLRVFISLVKDGAKVKSRVCLQITGRWAGRGSRAGEDIRPAWPEAIRQSHGPEQSRGAIR